jgi:hypothetical protein
VNTGTEGFLELVSPNHPADVWHPHRLVQFKKAMVVAAKTVIEAASARLLPEDGRHTWNGNGAIRAMRGISNTDFQLKVRFLTTPTKKRQAQGFVIENDSANWIRFGTYSLGTQLIAFASVSTNGEANLISEGVVPEKTAPYLRLTRTGDGWDGEYSLDGTTWTRIASFEHKIDVRSAGVFAGDAGQGAGYTAQVDFFESRSDPIADEDRAGVGREDVAPVARNDSYDIGPTGSIQVSAADGVLRNDLPDSSSRSGGDADLTRWEVTLSRHPAHGAIGLRPDGGFTYTAGPSYPGLDSFVYSVMNGKGGAESATVSLTSGNTGPKVATGGIAFSKLIVDDSMPLAHVALAADLDLDGDVDIVATSEASDTVAWFENDGELGFTRRDIDANLESAYPASLVDLDTDGDVDVLAGGYRSDEHVWYENKAAAGFQKHVIARQDGPHSILASDLDGDEDLDLVIAGQDANEIQWLRNDGRQRFTSHVIDAKTMGVKSALPVDLDGDGDTDLVAASFFDDTIAWYDNDGSMSFRKKVIDSAADGAYFASAADLDSDGDLDVVSASQLDNTIAWYRNEGGRFSKRAITEKAQAARFVTTADLDHDGDLDVISASVDDNAIAVHLNDGSANFASRIIDSAAIGAYGAVPADVNGDGVLDIVGASKNDGIVSILIQERAHELVADTGQTVTIGSAVLSATDNEQAPEDLRYELLAAPTLGTLWIEQGELREGATFTQADLNARRLSYKAGAEKGVTNLRLALSDGIAPPLVVSFRLTIGPEPVAGTKVSDDFDVATE